MPTDDIGIKMLMNMLGGLQSGPDYTQPIFPKSWGEAGDNLLRGLQWYGQENLRRQAGVPYQDPTQTALARAKLIEDLNLLKMKRDALAPFGGNLMEAIKPRERVEEFPIGGTNPETGMPASETFTRREYPGRVAASLYGINLPQDTGPEAIQNFLERQEMHKNWAEQSRLRTDIANQEIERKKTADEERATLAKEKAEQAKIIQAEKKRKAYYDAMIHAADRFGLNPDEVAEDFENSFVDGEFDPAKFVKSLGKNKAFLEKQRQHNDRMSIAKTRIAMENKRAEELKKRFGESRIFEYHRALWRQYDEELKGFMFNPKNMLQPLPQPPESIDTLLQRAREMSLETPRGVPAPQTGHNPFVSPAPQGGDRVKNWLEGR